MNVLLVSQYFTGGGLERMVRLLGEGLTKNFGCKVYLFSFDSEDDENLRNSLLEKNIISIHKKKNSGFSFKTIRELVRVIRTNNIDVVHTHESAPLIYSFFAKLLSGRRIKIIHTQHSFIHLQTRPFIRFYDKFFQFFAKFTTAVSPQVVEEYNKIGVSPSRIKFIPNGVEFPNHFVNELDKQALRNQLISTLPDPSRTRLAIGIKDLWMISMARVHPKKGQDHLIKIWGNLPSDIRQRSLLVLAGPETSPGELQRLYSMSNTVPDNDRIVFTGAVNSPVSWLQSSDIFLSASEYEGMPLAPIEACGAGLPLVLSEIEGHRLLSSSAHFFDFNVPETGAKAISECTKARDANLSTFVANCQKQALEIQAQYSIRKMAQEYYDLYKQAQNQ